jgi:hypothetical protein
MSGNQLNFTGGLSLINMVATQESKLEQADYRDFYAELAALPPTDAPVENVFTPGLMTRKIFMKAGSAHLSKKHGTEHQFVILQGACLVSENGGPNVLMVAPFHGITKPGTWRKLFIIMDCVWLTMHPTDKTTVEEVEADIIASTDETK